MALSQKGGLKKCDVDIQERVYPYYSQMISYPNMNLRFKLR